MVELLKKLDVDLCLPDKHLCYACKIGNLKMMKELLQTNGPNINRSLVYACKNRNIEVIKFLIERSADVNYSYYVTLLENAFFIKEMKRSLNLLLEKGAQPRYYFSKSHLLIAREMNNEKIIELLISYGAFIDEKG